MILVTGATGNVGSHLVRDLAAINAPTRALVRKSQARRPLHELGIETSIGAFEDAHALRTVFDGIERVFILSPAGVDAMVAQQLQVLAAARQSPSVRHVVKLSSIAAEEPDAPSIVGAHRRIEEAIERSGIAWTHLRPNWFMQNELGQSDVIGADGVFSAPDVTQVSMIDARDVAAVAARVLTSQGHEGKAYTLTGPQSLGYEDVAAIYSSVLGRRVRWQGVSLEQARELMLETGLASGLATGFTEIMRRYRKGGITRDVRPEAERLLGRTPRSFAQFVRDHNDAYAARLVS
jgi:uncharacterized protein YbjT (DUF2867 family)